MSSDEISEDLCDCGYPMFHELTCAYLDALYRQKLDDGDVLIVDLPVPLGNPRSQP